MISNERLVVDSVVDFPFDHKLTAEDDLGGCLRRLGLLLS